MIILLLSTLLLASASSWVVAWVALELNTVSMCFLITDEMKKSKKENTPTANYLVVQALTSVTMLVMLCTPLTAYAEVLATLSVCMKTGVWPLHSWYVKVVEDLGIKMKSTLILMTWQKVAPLVIITALPCRLPLLVGLILLTSSVPLMSLSMTSSITGVMATSSIINMGWMLSCLTYSTSILMVFLTLYFMSLSIALNYFKHLNKKDSWEKTIPTTKSMLVLGNLGGLPPLTMFTAKVMVLKGLTAIQLLVEMGIWMTISSCILLYHYMWTTLPSLTLTPPKEASAPSILPMSHTSLMVVVLSVGALLMIIP